jgi:RNA polymerase sigma factor (sigma-70 family)
VSDGANRPFQSFLSITENRSKILAMIVTMVQDFELAEDLFQETVLEILKSEASFDPARSFPAWACGIAKNVVRRYWREKKKMPHSGVSEILADLAEITVESDTEIWRQERVALRRCLQKVPPRMRRLLTLRYGYNYRGRELAERTAYRQGSIRTTLARLRRELKVCIQAQAR